MIEQKVSSKFVLIIVFPVQLVMNGYDRNLLLAVYSKRYYLYGNCIHKAL